MASLDHPQRALSTADSFRWRLLAWGTLGLALMMSGGCAYTGGLRNYIDNGLKVGPNYRKPVAAVEDQWIDAYDEHVLQELPRNNDWWTVYDDPVMTDLVNTAFRQNLPLQEAGLRVLASRAELGIAIGSLFPQQQQAYGELNHIQISKTALESRPLLATRVPRSFDRWSIGFDAAWELDVWGRFRRQIEASDASLQASVEEYDDILVSLIAETASAYVEMRTAQEQLRLARANVEAQKGTLDIAKSRYDTGEADELDVYQAQTNVSNTEALIPEYEELVRVAQIRLCVLMGMPPRDLSPELGEGTIPTAPKTVALGIPADLLRRRPDVRRAEREVAAQSEQIGIAASELLPQFAIKGSIGYDAPHFRDMFRTSSNSGLIAPGFEWDVLNYGRLKNNVLLQDARFQERAVHYQQIVLKANADVERAVVAFLQGQRKVEALQVAVAANKEALQIATDQYTSGETNYNQIFTLQAFLVQEENALASARGGVARALIAIYKALGGGWQIRLEPEMETVVVEDGVMPAPVIEDVDSATDELIVPPAPGPADEEWQKPEK